MARYTLREFATVVGLKTDQDGTIRSGIILKALCGLGLAKEVGKKQGSTGRPAVVYEVQDPIVIPLGATQGTTVKEVAVAVAPAPVAVASAPVAPVVGYYDDDDED